MQKKKQKFKAGFCSAINEGLQISISGDPRKTKDDPQMLKKLGLQISTRRNPRK